MQNLWQDLHSDLRYALRQLRNAPMFTLTAVLTLGLGLGAAATMWSVVQAVLLAPVPYPEPQRLVGLGFAFPHDKPTQEQIGASADFLQQHSRSFAFTGIAEDSNVEENLSSVTLGAQGARPAQVHMRFISSGYLPTLGVRPELGRTFTAEEDRPDGPKAIMLSDALWRISFHADPRIVGNAVHLDEDVYTVVGVMPAGFKDPSTSKPTQVWEPLALAPSQPGYDGDNYIMSGRLRVGVSMAAAQAELDTLNTPFYKQFPHYLKWTEEGTQIHAHRIWPLSQVLTSNVRESLLTMLAAVSLVLLLACLNLSGLVSTRIAQRSAELQIRTALGASRWSVMRLLLSEGILLASASAALAVAFLAVARPAILANSPLALPELGVTAAWQMALLIGIAAAAACFLITGVPSALALRRPLALPGRSALSADRAQTRFGAVLVASQACLAMVLLAGASLLLGVFLHLQSMSPGFAPQHLVAAQVILHGNRYDSTLHKTQFIASVEGTLQHTPGISAVAAIDGLPLDKGLNVGMSPDNRNDMPRAAELRPVTSAYIRTMGLHLIAGRGFEPTDNAQAMPVALISETAAKQWWPGQNPLGRQVRYRGDHPHFMQVVGIVADTHAASLAEPFHIMVYVPYSQLPDEITKIVNRWITTSFVLRVADGVPIAHAVEQAIRSADPQIPVARILPLQSVIDTTTAAPQFFSILASSFAAFALLLSGIGLFGLLSYQVSQRTREFGLRLALGASRERMLRMVLGRGLLLTCTGAAIGLAISALLPKLIAGLLPSLIPMNDMLPATLLEGTGTAMLLAACLLLLIAVAACAVPALRAATIEPAKALKAE